MLKGSTQSKGEFWFRLHYLRLTWLYCGKREVEFMGPEVNESAEAVEASCGRRDSVGVEI